MSRSDMMEKLLRLARLAEHCDQTGESPQDAIGQEGLRNASRRKFAKGALAGSATLAVGSLTPSALAGIAKIGGQAFGGWGAPASVAIVGAGLAGLSCANELVRLGINANVFEAADRVGGRVSSLRGFFPGQVVERGGEFISASHHTMIGYARNLGLKLENFGNFPGNAFYNFGGRMYSEAQVVEEYRAFAVSIRQDLATLNHPTADKFTENDALFDYMSLDDYLTLHQAGPLLREVISSAYKAEYGAGIDELSCISFLRFIYGDKRTKQAPFGIFSSQNLRIVDGNDRITTGLASTLSTPVTLGHKLVAMRKLAGGRIRLTFNVAGRTVNSEHDIVVMTLPFSVLRDVELHSSLELPASKHLAIKTTGMGDHNKLMVGFKEPYWYVRHGLNGTGYTDIPSMQATWESNPSTSTASRAVLTAYIGGSRARSMNAASLQTDAKAFLGNLESILPGANNAAVRDARGKILAYNENWSTNPLSKGSHTCNRPGYFTTNAHNEGKAVGNLLFAGEHTSSFYEWQGFMEGAALSGLRAASEVYSLARVK